MMKRYIQLTATICCFALLSSCGSQPAKKDNSAEKEVQNSKLVGGDRDEHGCIASAGYQWSDLLKDCIRPFEKGIRLEATSTDKSLAAYVVTNSDLSKIEIFLPKVKERPILSRTSNTTEEMAWTSDAAKGLLVKNAKGIWSVYQNNELIFTSDTDK